MKMLVLFEGVHSSMNRRDGSLSEKMVEKVRDVLCMNSGWLISSERLVLRYDGES